MKLWFALDGYKTYLVAIGGIVYATLGYSLRHLDADAAFKIIWEALGLSTLRHGMSRI